jgi:hypothetical protein
MKAVNLAYDMADRIRANPTGINFPAGTNNYVLTTTGNTTATDCATATCTPDQVAASDLFNWDAMITDTANGTGLPGNVTREIVQTAAATATTPTVLTIRLKWTEVNSGDLRYDLQVQI